MEDGARSLSDWTRIPLELEPRFGGNSDQSLARGRNQLVTSQLKNSHRSWNFRAPHFLHMPAASLRCRRRHRLRSSGGELGEALHWRHCWACQEDASSDPGGKLPSAVLMSRKSPLPPAESCSPWCRTLTRSCCHADALHGNRRAAISAWLSSSLGACEPPATSGTPQPTAGTSSAWRRRRMRRHPIPIPQCRSCQTDFCRVLLPAQCAARSPSRSGYRPSRFVRRDQTSCRAALCRRNVRP